jgi:serine/threonine protein kinase
MGAKHYNTAVDCWAVGCVLAELASLRPIFKGEEAKLDSKKNVLFQRDQLIKIFEVLGTPNGNFITLSSSTIRTSDGGYQRKTGPASRSCPNTRICSA